MYVLYNFVLQYSTLDGMGKKHLGSKLHVPPNAV